MNKSHYLEIMNDCLSDFKRILERENKLLNNAKDTGVIDIDFLEKFFKCHMDWSDNVQTYSMAVEGIARETAKIIPLKTQKKKSQKIIPPIRIHKK
jgi:hypothetical protein